MVQFKIRLTEPPVNELQKYIFTGCNDMNRFVIYYMVITLYLLQTYIYFIIMKILRFYSSVRSEVGVNQCFKKEI